jgi:hypothetical protein
MRRGRKSRCRLTRPDRTRPRRRDGARLGRTTSVSTAPGEAGAAGVINAHHVALGDSSPLCILGIDRDRFAAGDLALCGLGGCAVS